MKYLLFILIVCVGIITATSGCAGGVYYATPPNTYLLGTFEFCDDWGCRMITAPYYYTDNEVVYWDAHFGCWIGPHGYWIRGGWRPGFVVGYHERYNGGFYHRFTVHPGGWRAGSGYHGHME